MFYFNSAKFNYWDIYKCISRYYPLGVNLDDAPHFYNSYPGRKEFEDVIVHNLYNDTIRDARWQPLAKAMQAVTGKEIKSFTGIITPCYCGVAELNTTEAGDMTRFCDLHFFISVLGPFYSIIGMDSITLRMNEKIVRSVNFLTVSPENHFEEYFKSFSAIIEEQFPSYRFVPAGLAKQVMPDLTLPYIHDKACTVFNALFSDNIDFNTTIIGDLSYLASQWEINTEL